MRADRRFRYVLVVMAMALTTLKLAQGKLGDTRGFVPCAPHASVRRRPSALMRSSQVAAPGRRRVRSSAPAAAAAAAEAPPGPAVTPARQPAHWVMVLRKLGADAAAAAAAALSVSPFIAIFDRSIILSASRGGSVTAQVMAGLKEMARPVSFMRMREVWWVWALYAGTYVAANGIGTIAEHMGVNTAAPKLVGTTAVNLPASIVKDQALARMFSAGSVAAAAAAVRMPLGSLALFTLRDIVSIAASFTLPDAVASHLTEVREWSSAAAEGCSQLLVPSLMQLVTTPMHLVGLDLFNRPAASTAMRMQLLSRLYGSSLALRFGRTGIAFGLGGVVNRKVREALHSPIRRAAAAAAVA